MTRPHSLLPRSCFALLVVVVVGRAARAAPTQEMERLKFNNPGLVVELGVGLWATPIPLDYDHDGKLDLLVLCSGRPFRGLWLFRNSGVAGADPDMPVFEKPVRLDDAKSNVQPSYVNGKLRVLVPGEEITDFPSTLLKSSTKLPVPESSVPTAKRIRSNQWRYADFDGDGVTDLIIGVEDWGDYGWDDAYNAKGEWTNGPLHGLVYVLHNRGSDTEPNYDPPIKVESAGKAIDTFGMPSPCFADFDGDGNLDLICGDFRDRLTYFKNTGTRSKPVYAAPVPLKNSSAAPIRMPACMIQVIAFDWNGDGKVDLLVGQEDGSVAYIKNLGISKDGEPIFSEPKLFQQQADDLKYGVLSTPVVFDWDGDGKPDLICGDAAGNIGFIKNLDGANPPKWAAPQELEADGKVIRILAGGNGSIQGPAEEKWGYTTISVADWDRDGLPDIVTNSIWGKVVWYRNVGSRTQPKLAAAKPIEVSWPGENPKPSWLWWEPMGRELVTQWRTTPLVRDIDGDGSDDLVSLDRDGYLSLFRRDARSGDLQPPRHVFRMALGEESVFDNNGKPVELDSGDRKELALPAADGRLTYYAMDPMNHRSNSPTKFADRRNDPAYGEASAQVEGLPVRLTGGWAGRSGRRKFTMADWDGDGKLDLLVNSNNVNFLRNVASEPNALVFKDMGPVAKTLLAGHDTSPTTCDFDGDGIPDLLVGAEDGHFYFLKNPRARSGAQHNREK